MRIEQVDVDTYRRELLTQLPAPIVELAIRSQGNVDAPPADLATDAVFGLLGREPLTFAEWARDHASDFA